MNRVRAVNEQHLRGRHTGGDCVRRELLERSRRRHRDVLQFRRGGEIQLRGEEYAACSLDAPHQRIERVHRERTDKTIGVCQWRAGDDRNRLFIYDLATGKSKEIASGIDEDKSFVKWTNTGIWLNTLNGVRSSIYKFDPASGNAEKVNMPVELVGSIDFNTDGSKCWFSSHSLI